MLEKWLPGEHVHRAGAARKNMPQPNRLRQFLAWTSRAKARVAGNAPVYAALLAKFAANYMDAPAEISAAVQYGDHAEAARLVHTLKGVMGNIAAKTVYAVAIELENSLRDAHHSIALTAY